MRVAGAQLLAVVRREIDDQQPPARPQHARRLGDRRARLLREVEHVVQDRDIRRAIRHRQRIQVRLAQFGVGPVVQLRPRQPQHLRRPVDAQRAVRLVAEQLQHPPRARTDIDQAAERPGAQHRRHRRLDLALRDVERSDRIPFAGMPLEPRGRARRAIGAHRGQARGVRHRPMIGLILRPGVDRARDRLRRRRLAQRHEHPAALLAPFGKARIAQDLHVPADPRLALPQHLRQLAHRQLHRPQQREDAQPRRVGKGTEDVECMGHDRINI